MLFSTRRGGVSTGPFASLNLGRLTDDQSADVDVNRARLAESVGLPRERFLYGRQVHGARVRRATEPPGLHRPVADEDGQATALPDAAALVFVADCLPVALVADGAVAALHGGWRGLARGVLGRAWWRCASSAPAARSRRCSGPRRVAAVTRWARRSTPTSPPMAPASGERNLDLALIARAQLEAAGVREVHDTELCTLCSDPSLFFSHRRDGGTTGRQAGVVWRA